MNKVKELYVLPDEAHVDEAIRLMLMGRYRDWRYRLREKHYLKFNTDKERLANCPKQIDPNQWKWLVEQHWGTKRFRRISEANKENKKKQKMPACCGTVSFVRILTELRNDSNEEDDRPEYIKLFLKERKKKNGEWSDNEAEAAFNKLQEMHKAQVEEYGADNLTVVESYTRAFGHKSGYVRGLGEGPLPLKRVNHSELNTSESYVSQADLKVRIQTEVERQVAEISKKKEEILHICL
ncbi:hypothetical protein M5689_008120 [Euphorbia peplus]|nr:hypothetical protein M5689_008120 [Euphorbia peplus]